MTIVPRNEIGVRPPDVASADLHLESGPNGLSVDLAVKSLAGGVALHVGLDRVLNAASGVDRLMNGPDALARFRAGAVPADPSPIATRGMTVRAGDPYAEVATRYAVGVANGPPPVARAEANARIDGGGVTVRAELGTDTRGVGPVRDAAAAASLPQRVNGPDGTAALRTGIEVGAGSQRAAATGSAAASPNGVGLAVGLQGREGSTAPVGSFAPTLAPAPGGGTVANVSLAGLANILGGPVATPAHAPPGAVLAYAATDGATAIELRTANGFAGALATSALPLTGATDARSGQGYTLIGIFVPPAGGLPMSPFNVAAAVGPAAMATAAATTAAAEAPPPTAAATAAVPEGDGIAPPVSPHDGRDIPAGQPAPSGEGQNSFADQGDRADATDRPYLHAIWYDILALRFAEHGVMLLERSTALRDVVWATAMEHGPFADATASDVLSGTSRHLDMANADDAAIIAALFAERSRTDDAGNLVHYPEVLPFDRDRVLERLADEAEIASSRLSA